MSFKRTGTGVKVYAHLTARRLKTSLILTIRNSLPPEQRLF